MRWLLAVLGLVLVVAVAAGAAPAVEDCTVFIPVAAPPPASWQVDEVPQKPIAGVPTAQGLYVQTPQGWLYLGLPTGPSVISLPVNGGARDVVLIHPHYAPVYLKISTLLLPRTRSGIYRWPVPVSMQADSFAWQVWYEWVHPHPIEWGVLIVFLAFVGGQVARAAAATRRKPDVEKPVAMAGGRIVDGRWMGLSTVRKDDTGELMVAKDKTDPSAPDAWLELFSTAPEIATVAALDHPGLPTVRAHGTWEGRPYLVTTRVEGESLKQYEGSLWSLDRFLDVFRPLLDTVCYLHGRGIANLDLTPSRVLVRPKGIKLLGAGTSQRLADSPYAAKESPGPSSDQFSLGVVAFEMLSGRRPLEGDRLEKLCPNLPAVLCETVHRMMAPEPSARFPNLEAVLEQMPSSRDVNHWAAQPSRRIPAAPGESETAV